jgi:hypothetical protein
MNLDTYLMKNEVDTNADTVAGIGEETVRDENRNGKHSRDSAHHALKENENVKSDLSSVSFIHDPSDRSNLDEKSINPSTENVAGTDTKSCNVKDEDLGNDVVNKHSDDGKSESRKGETLQNSTSTLPSFSTYHHVPIWPLSLKLGFPSFSRNAGDSLSNLLSGSIQKLSSSMRPRVEDIVAELVDEVNVVQPEGIEKMLPVTLDSVQFKGGTLMVLAYGDREPR